MFENENNFHYQEMVRRIAQVTLCSLLLACDAESGAEPQAWVTEDAVGMPLAGLDPQWQERFDAGDAEFERPFREADGLGPVYIRQSCASCHQDDLRGPGAVTKVVAADGTPLPHGNTLRPYVAAGAEHPIEAPTDVEVIVSRRLGPPVLGMGYLEAIDEAELQRVAAEQAATDDGVAGVVHRVTWQSQPNPDRRFHAYAPGDEGLVGRFGLKARLATIDEFVADALQGDMSITSPLRPDELPNPDGLLDDLREGVDVDATTVNLMADYLRLLEIPARPVDEAGAALFDEVGCATCHVPSLRTRADYPIEALADVDAPVYSDMLLHDMGEALADGVVELGASGRQWRTAPLVGLRFQRAFLHDGRASDLRTAILDHRSPGSEASGAVDAFEALSDADAEALLTFVESR